MRWILNRWILGNNILKINILLASCSWQQRNYGGGWATMRERSERVESPGTYVTEWVSRCHFPLALCSFGPPSRALVVITWRARGGMPLHDAVGINCKKGAITENQGSGVKYMGQGVYLDDCVCVGVCVCVLSDLTWLLILGGGRKSWYI